MDREISVRRLNQQTSAVLSEVLRGRSLTITSAGRPVARITPISTLPAGIDRLVAGGIATAPTEMGPLSVPPVTAASDVDVASAIAHEREQQPW